MSTRLAAVMSRNVICVRADMRARDVAQLLAERNVSGAPVVDESGRPIGMITQNDLVRFEAEHLTVGEAGRFQTDVEDYRDISEQPASHGETPIEKIITREVIALGKDDTVAAAARLMRENHIHRVLVTEKSVLVGIVTSMDLLGVLAEEA